MSTLIDKLGEISSPQYSSIARHELLEVLTIALSASICGAQDCDEFSAFASDREPLLRGFLTLKHGLPSQDALARVFRLLDPAGFRHPFETFLDDLGEAGDGVRSIDGASLRRSFESAARRSILHVVTAFGSEERVVIAHRSGRDSSDGRCAAGAFLDLLVLDGVLVIGGAAHARIEIAQAIHARGGDWLFSLGPEDHARGAELAAFFDGPPVPIQTHETTEVHDDRIEHRRLRVTSSVHMLQSACTRTGGMFLPGLATLARVETEIRAPAQATVRFDRYYLSSAILTPERLARAVRGHDIIDSPLLWILDVGFDRERPATRRDNGSENIATLERIASALLSKARPKMSVARKRSRSGWSDAFARTIIGQMR